MQLKGSLRTQLEIQINKNLLCALRVLKRSRQAGERAREKQALDITEKTCFI